jgi:hypothetical protein
MKNLSMSYLILKSKPKKTPIFYSGKNDIVKYYFVLDGCLKSYHVDSMVEHCSILLRRSPDFLRPILP